jgi:phage shock protein A
LGITNRVITFLKQILNSLLNKFQDPGQQLDYSYTKQKEALNKLRRDIAKVVTAKKQLEMQKTRLGENIRVLEEQAHRSIEQNREDLARLALERKNVNLLQFRPLKKQIEDIQTEQYKLEQIERQLALKVEQFRSKKEILKAQYSAAEAQVRIKENITGVSEELAGLGTTMDRAEEKTEKMMAKAQALDEMIDSGVLTDYTHTSDDIIERELKRVNIEDPIDEELQILKTERVKKKKKTLVEVHEDN